MPRNLVRFAVQEGIQHTRIVIVLLVSLVLSLSFHPTRCL